MTDARREAAWNMIAPFAADCLRIAVSGPASMLDLTIMQIACMFVCDESHRREAEQKVEALEEEIRQIRNRTGKRSP